MGEEEFKQRLKAVLQIPLSNQSIQQEQMNEESGATQTDPSVTSTITSSSQPEGDETEDQSIIDRERRNSIRAGKKPVESGKAEDDAKAPQRDWRATQRRREQQQREERTRVLNQIRQDKEDRKRRNEQRKATIAANNQNNTTDTTQTQGTKKPPSSTQFRIQVRLFDGTSVRSAFSPGQTVRRDVRPWIDSQRSGDDTPYNLKHILNPLPNRTLSISEEDQTLAELGLGPTASLVMVPVQVYTEAYAGGDSSLPVRGLYAGYRFITGTVGAVFGGLWSFLGYGQGPTTTHTETATSETSNSPVSSAGSTRANTIRPTRNNRVNIRTLFDGANDQNDNEFYNGNQVRTQLVALSFTCG